jgi:Amt family ammonium transporter
MGKKINFIILSTLVIICVLTASNYQELSSEIDSGDTAWMIVASAFVLLMTPGLSFFYGGMVNKKNIISTMLQSFIALGVISILWVLVGFSLAFGDSIGGIIGNPFTYFAFKNVGSEPNTNFSSTIPFLLFALFQLKFAIITPALITGSLEAIFYLCCFSAFLSTVL